MPLRLQSFGHCLTRVVDDVVVCSPDRVADVEVVIRENVRRHARIVSIKASLRSGTGEESRRHRGSSGLQGL